MSILLKMLFVGRYWFIANIPTGKEMWLGKWPITGGSNKNIIYKCGIVNCYFHYLRVIQNHQIWMCPQNPLAYQFPIRMCSAGIPWDNPVTNLIWSMRFKMSPDSDPIRSHPTHKLPWLPRHCVTKMKRKAVPRPTKPQTEKYIQAVGWLSVYRSLDLEHPRSPLRVTALPGETPGSLGMKKTISMACFSSSYRQPLKLII